MFHDSYSMDETISTLDKLDNLELKDYNKILSITFYGVEKFYEIHPKIFEFVNLEKLILCSVDLKNISPDIKKIKKLKFLMLSGNKELISLPIEINFLENLEELFLPSSCINYNIGGLYNLQNLQYDSEPTPEKKFSIYNIYENKMLVIDSDDNNTIPDNITHINCHRSLYHQLDNLPIGLEFFRTVLINKQINFPCTLKELHTYNSFFKEEELKVPFDCKVHIENVLNPKNYMIL